MAAELPADRIAPTPRTKVVRYRERGRYDRETLYSILDEGLICHIGFTVEEQPFVLPTTHARVDDRLYLHGSIGSRMLRSMRGAVPMCVTVTLIDGLVLARSAMHHSMNYRSVMVLGKASEVTEEDEKRRALDALVNHVVSGRSALVRRPNEKELKSTLVLRVPIDEASAKVRTGPPVDDEEDYALPTWAGVLPLRLEPGQPIDDPRLAAGTAVPASVARYVRGS